MWNNEEVQAVSYVECSALTSFGLTKLFDEAIKIALQSEKASMAVPLSRQRIPTLFHG